MKDVFENATIIQKNGLKQIFEAILITDNGIYTGSLKKIISRGKEFEEHGFIPLNQIQKITILNKHGKSKDIDL